MNCNFFLSSEWNDINRKHCLIYVHYDFETYCLFPFLSSYGQNLKTSTFVGETLFAILIAILGLVLFAHLIGNMQVFNVNSPISNRLV